MAPSLVRPKRHDVDAGVADHRGQVGAGGDEGVGDAGAVEVHEHPGGVGRVGHRTDLVRRVDRAELGRLADRHHPRLRVVLAAEPLEVGREVRRARACRRRAAPAARSRRRSGRGAASSTTMWAQSAQMTASHGCRTVARPTTLAPVPPQHGRASTGASNSSRRRSSMPGASTGRRRRRGRRRGSPRPARRAPRATRRRRCRWRRSPRGRGQVGHVVSGAAPTEAAGRILRSRPGAVKRVASGRRVGPARPRTGGRTRCRSGGGPEDGDRPRGEVDEHQLPVDAVAGDTDRAPDPDVDHRADGVARARGGRPRRRPRPSRGCRGRRCRR